MYLLIDYVLEGDMSVSSIGKLRSRRYVRVELKKGVMGWKFTKGMYNRMKHCIHRKTAFYAQPYSYQAICGMWAYLPIACVQVKDRGEGKTFKETKK